MGYLSITRILLHILPLASSGSYSLTPTLQLSFSSKSSSCCSSALLKSLPAFNPNSISKHKNKLHTLQSRSFGGALGLKHALCNEGSPADSNGYGPLLQECTNCKAWAEGKQVHARMLINGLEGDEGLGAKLVNMYATCGSMADARLVFDKMCQQNVLLWNTMIRGYAWNGPYEEALTLYYRMQELGISPNNFTFPFVLKACSGLSSIEDGMEIHYHIIRDRFESDVYVETALVDMYVKCHRIEAARQVFDKMSRKDAVAWNAMIAGYAQNGHANEALALFHQMLSANVKPTSVTIVSVLPACADLEALEQGG